jgi:hypothetical protein
MLYATYTALWRVGVLVRDFSSTTDEQFPWLLNLPGFDPTLAIPVLLIAAYCGSIWFFFYVRRNPFESQN